MSNLYEFEKGKEKGYPEKCPITGRRYFMELEHPRFGIIPTYGGPFDSYTIPVKDEDYEYSYTQERYNHDEGGWSEAESIIMED